MRKIIGKKELDEAFVKIAEPPGEITKSRRVASDGAIVCRQDTDQKWRSCLLGCQGCIALLIVAFIKPLCSLAVHSATTELDSYILLVPFISAYLLHNGRKQLPGEYFSSPGFAMVPLGAGLAALVAPWCLRVWGWPVSRSDSLTFMALAFVCFLTGVGFFFLGRKWMAAAAFPIAFLIFIVPLPNRAVDWLETASKLASTDAAHLFFLLSGTPVLRDGTVFHLPGIVFEVAQECSGIRSSWALLMTGLVASHLFLKSPWRRVVFVAFIVPLGILRNGFRILVIGLLCVQLGPNMIHSIIHKQGGPVFFALSLVPLFLLLWWLRTCERSRSSGRE
jgi:exosortase C (VPDSG-CTERM-specific)